MLVLSSGWFDDHEDYGITKLELSAPQDIHRRRGRLHRFGLVHSNDDFTKPFAICRQTISKME